MVDKLRISIQVTYNDRECDGIDVFINDLKKDYLIVQGKQKWLPSASDGGEVWLDIIADANILESLKNYIYNKPFEFVLECLFLKPLIKYLKKLAAKNEGFFGLRVKYIKLQYNDINIVIGALNSNIIPIIHAIMKSLVERIDFFRRECGANISEIQTPIDYNEHIDRGNPYQLNTLNDLEDNSIDKYLNLWRIIYGGGVKKLIYDFKNNVFYDDGVKR